MSRTKRGFKIGGVILCILLAVVLCLFIVALIRTALLKEEESFISFKGVEYSVEDSELQRYVGILGGAVQFKTVSKAIGDYNTEEILKLHDFLRESYPAIFNSSFIDVETVNTYSLLLTVKGSDPTLLPFMLASHLDVVPVDPDKWSHPPFLGAVMADPQTGEQCLWGRGAIDDKGGVVGILSALDLLISSGWSPRRSFYIGFGHDEEVGGYDGARHVGQLLIKRNVTLHFLLDEGLPIVQGIMTGIDSPVAMIGVTEKGRVDVKISTQAEGGHSSIPAKVQAIGKLANALTNIYKSPQPSMFGLGVEEDTLRYLAPKAAWPYKLFFGNTWLFGPLLSYAMSKKKESNAMIRTTTAITVINGGIKTNVMPQSAHAFINHRVHPAQSIEEVIAHDTAAIRDEEVKVEVTEEVDAHPISPYGRESIPYNLISGAVKHVYPDTITAPGLTIGNTDTKHYLSLTKYIYRFLPHIMSSSLIPGVHGNDERMPVSNMKSSIMFYRVLILAANDVDEDLYVSNVMGRKGAAEL